MSEKLILGLDIGTSSVKAIFINENGDVLERVEVKITTNSAEPGLAEQRAEDYLDALRIIAGFNEEACTKRCRASRTHATVQTTCD